MNKEQFISKIESICELPVNTLKGDESLVNSTLIDSLALLGLVSTLDKDFGVHLSLSEIMSAGTLNNLFAKIQKNLN